MATGEVEVSVTDLRILSEAGTPPIQIDEKAQTSEVNRLKYRYLDLRTPLCRKISCSGIRLPKRPGIILSKTAFWK